MTDYNEDPLESLLDEQTDIEFGIPEIRDKFDHGASEEKHGNLKTWSAEDFSSIYVRFYPHLVRHAKRFLTNEVQAEEVVQDAFLYMMTALPEIDSELGVLKFMKWKVRLLALDVIRATPNRRETLVDSFDDEQSAEETDSEIERADDMAVIGAALAKLNPRHREALIATVYEEKTSTEVATQMQLSENATRQLVFRARSAFKKALVGEAEVAGKSVSEILSIASKRASMAAKGAARTLSLLAVLGISSALAFTSFTSSGEDALTTANKPQSRDSSAERVDTSGHSDAQDAPNPVTEFSTENQLEPSNGSQSAPLAGEEPEIILATPETAEERNLILQNEDQQIGDDGARGNDGKDPAIVPVVDKPTAPDLTNVNLASLAGFTTKINRGEFSETNFANRVNYPVLLHSVEDALKVTVWLNLEKLTVNSIRLSVQEDGSESIGYPRSIGQVTSERSDASEQIMTISASDFFFVGGNNDVLQSPDLAGRFLNILITLDNISSIKSAVVSFTQ